MHITNCGRGIHAREVKGIELLQRALPHNWYAFTNLDLILGLGVAREIDVIIVGTRRVFLVDLKDLHGRIISSDEKWFLGKNDLGRSPAKKVAEVARDLSTLLKDALGKRPETRRKAVPNIVGLVVLTGQADRSGIAETERPKVLTADEFLAKLSTPKAERDAFGNIAEEILREPLTEPFWKERLTRFFNARAGSPLKPGQRRFQRFVAKEELAFPHPTGIYKEYDTWEEGAPQNIGTLRLWDFTQCPDTRFQTLDGRMEIAGREGRIYHWLKDRGEDIENVLLAPRFDEPEQGIGYWEIYDRRRRLRRLSEFAAADAVKTNPAARIELARQLLSALATMHRHGAAHLDLGDHSVWLELPTTVRLSHLLAAKYQDVQSLGRFRYQFLSSVSLPEDVLGDDAGPKRRDVYLVAVAVHMILFGRPPAGVPPVWDTAVDAERQFEVLHAWFDQALDIVASDRFADAGIALEVYNRATAARPTPQEIAAGLENYRGAIRSQMKLFAVYPLSGETFRESDRVDSWLSTRDGGAVVVKLWKQAAWGDLRREGGRILAFLDRAAGMRTDRPPGLPEVRDVMWLGDGIVVVQDYAEGVTLDAAMRDGPPPWESARAALAIAATLIEVVDELHERGIGHGDLKPGNVVLGPGGEIVLIDALDFSSGVDGDIHTSAYAPESGTVFERDRFAVIRMVEEILAPAGLAEEEALIVAKGIGECRERVPALATLLPLLDAVREAEARLDAPAARVAGPVLSLAVQGATTGPLEADEGFFFLRLYRSTVHAPLYLHLRGAVEEIKVRFDDRNRPARGERSQLPQGRIARVSKHEFHKVAMTLTVTRSDHTDLAALDALLQEPPVSEAIAAMASRGPAATAIEEEIRDATVSEEEADDLLAEEIAEGEKLALSRVDVRTMWQALIDAEHEMTTEGVAQLASRFDRGSRRYMVAFELQSGVFDYERNDTVGVLRQGRQGDWRRIGMLDLQASRPDMIAIVGQDLATTFRSNLVNAGQRLRFVSHFEVQSFRRRKGAVDRVLDGDSRSKNLFTVFDPDAGAAPQVLSHEPDLGLIGKYGLNGDQEEALKNLLRVRPVGLLQGPPGTGKTTFIAALTHYAITKGLARNVLLASQSHEAVNNAAEAVLASFRSFGGEPDILRVAANEEVVSDPLRPFHSARIERSLKDRFRAAFKERITIVGRTLGIEQDIVDDLVFVETGIRPVAGRIADLVAEQEPDARRIEGLTETLAGHLDRLGLPRDGLAEADWDGFADAVIGRLMSARWRPRGLDDVRLGRLRAALTVARDFMGSASRAQRSFESFLAGTRQIVVGTCVGLGRSSLGLTTTPFDLVIVDEAARCTAGELLVPLQAARWAVLVGDQAQLKPQHPPEVVNRVASRTGIEKHEIRRSDFERVFLSAYGEAASSRLSIQYRMLPAIGRVVSDAFYPGLKLSPGRPEPEIDVSSMPDDLSHPLTWVETDGLAERAFETQPEGGSSRINRVEADAVVQLLERWVLHEPFAAWLTTPRKHPVGIGVICMYAAQRDLIYGKLLRSPVGHLLGRHIKVGTVDSYQGKENAIIVLSLVRNNADGREQEGVGTIRPGFLSEPNRINVAASRAKDRLVVVGARRNWLAESPVALLAAGFDKQARAGLARSLAVEGVLPHAGAAARGARRRGGAADGVGGGAA
ncbi:AAA domain-containing protein [Methylobacterium fujisawaense]